MEVSKVSLSPLLFTSLFCGTFHPRIPNERIYSGWSKVWPRLLKAPFVLGGPSAKSDVPKRYAAAQKHIISVFDFWWSQQWTMRIRWSAFLQIHNRQLDTDLDCAPVTQPFSVYSWCSPRENLTLYGLIAFSTAYGAWAFITRRWKCEAAICKSRKPVERECLLLRC